MDSEPQVKVIYTLKDLYDEIELGFEGEKMSARPVCDSLKKIDSQYSNEEKIAEGGMKRIFKVFDTQLQRNVAMARLHTNAPETTHDSFIREARLTGLLQHPNIISVHSIGIAQDNTPFFTMELKKGDNLAKTIQQIHTHTGVFSKKNLDFLLEIFLKVCDAIDYAHSKDVLHLDLKPENIQVGKYGEVKICDWGLGKVIDNDDCSEFDQLLFNPDLLNNMTLSGEVKGTPGYMAPEQVSKNLEKTRQTDIYSLGAILYTILTGKCAYEGDTNDILNATMSGDFEPPSARSQGLISVPESLNAVVLEAMHTNPEKRYRSVSKFKNELTKYMDGRATIAENASFLKQLKLFYKRNCITCFLVLLFMLCLVSIGIYFNYQLKSKNTILIEERNRADHSMNLALHRQLEAQSALNRMINEKNLVRSMIQGQANDIKQIYFLSDTLVFSEPLKALQKAEGLLNKIQKGDPAYAWASMQLAYIFSLRQDFSQACQFFEISSNDPPLLKLSQKYARLQKKSALLTPKQLMDYWDELLVSKYRISDALKMLKYDSELRSKPTEHFKLVEYMLKVINPHWDKQAFIYDHTKGNLKISGQGFYRLAFKKNEFFLTGKKPTERIFIFRPGEIKQLDISDSSFSDLNFLLGSEIQELNICRTKITDLTPIRKMAQLRKIILDRDDMNLKDIPSQIQVEYK